MTVGSMIQAREVENPETEEPPLTRRDSLVRLGILIAALAVIGYLDWGWLAFIFVLLISVVLHELGHFLLARKGGMRASEFFVGFGPRIWSVKRGETEFGIKAILAGGYVKTPGMTNLEDIPPELESRTFRAQPYGRRARMILAGPFTNLLLALLSFCFMFAIFNEHVYRDTGTPLVTVAASGPAVSSGLQDNDKIVSVNGQTFTKITDMTGYVRAHPGATIALGIVRNGSEQTIDVPLAATNPNTGEAVGYLGVSFQGIESQIARNPIEAVGRGFQEVGHETAATVSGIGRIFSPSGLAKLWDTVIGQRKDDPTQRASSVVGIGRDSSTLFRTGFENSLFLFGALNLALGLFNLLPIIPFDGGHFVVATYERLRSRKNKPYRVDFAKVVPFFAPLMAVVAFVVLSSFILDIRR